MTLDVFDDDAIERGVAVMRASRDDAPDDASDDAELLASAPDWLLAWFLRDRKLDADKARAKTLKYLEWRRSGYGESELKLSSEVAEEAASGKAVLLGERDAQKRPVVYVTLTVWLFPLTGMLKGCPKKGCSGPSSKLDSTQSTITEAMSNPRQSSKMRWASSAVAIWYWAFAEI